MVTAKDLKRYKAMLIARREELWARGVDLPPAGGVKGDVMDVASADAEADLQVRFRESDRQLLKDIGAAVARIQAKTFGVCEACKRPIAKARLDLVPWARLCRDCGEREQGPLTRRDERLE
jgi:DnaK suppressor protein